MSKAPGEGQGAARSAAAADEDDSDLMRTAPGTGPSQPARPAPPDGLPVLTAAVPAKPIPRAPKPSSPAPPAAAAEASPQLSLTGMPLLTAAVAELPAAPKPRPSSPPPAAIPPPRPSSPPGIISAAAALLEGKPSSAPLSTFEQLQALEQAEPASLTGRGGVVATERALLFEKPPPPMVDAPPPSPPPAKVPEAAGPELEPNPFSGDSDRSELWQPVGGAAPAPQGRIWAPESSARRKPAPSAPRAYVPPAFESPVAPPPRRSRPVMLGLAFAAVVGAGVALVTQLAPHVDAVVPAPAVAVPEVPVAAAEPEPAVAPPPKPPEPVPTGSVRLRGVPRGASVSVDGAPLQSAAGEVTLPVGAHQLAVDLKGYAPWEASVDLKAGEVKVVKVTLKKARKKK